MHEFLRPAHRSVGRVLKALDSAFLAQAECYFGGGTQLALAFGEYRESRDIDFLCSSRAGFRMLRECVTQDSLGTILRRPLRLARDVRADRDGIRTFLMINDQPLKFEILLEGRFDLSGSMDLDLGVPVLDLDVAIAEKFLANTDRGMDESTQARDLIDLAFLADSLGQKALRPGLESAELVYGRAVRRQLRSSLDDFQKNRARAAAWIESLAVTDTATLRRGLRTLRRLVKA